MYDFTLGEFNENLARVDNLIKAYRELEDNDIGDIQVRKDILRASVVLLHSSLEEVIRNLYVYRLPAGRPENLNKIPFVGHETTHRPKEILLGHLSSFKGRFVENIIFDSINSYVDTLNINGVAQLLDCIRMADISVKSFDKEDLASLGTLMARRHQIVHQMDRKKHLDPLKYPINKISINQVNKWKKSLREFVKELTKLVPPPPPPPKSPKSKTK